VLPAVSRPAWSFLSLVHVLIAWGEQLDTFLLGEMLTGTRRERKLSCVYGTELANMPPSR
jgi:hypothetical protein